MQVYAARATSSVSGLTTYGEPGGLQIFVAAGV